MSLLRMNCILPRECKGRGIPAERQPDGFPYFTMDNIVNEGWSFAYARTRNESCAPHLFQVPWGKHNPHGWRAEESKGGHLAFTFRWRPSRGTSTRGCWTRSATRFRMRGGARSSAATRRVRRRRRRGGDAVGRLFNSSLASSLRTNILGALALSLRKHLRAGSAV